jgi:putative transposase
VITSDATRGDTRPPVRRFMPNCNRLFQDARGREGERPREPKPKRKKPASGVLVSLDRPTIVFLTVCAEKRRRWLAQSRVHDELKMIWQTEARAWLVGRYILMPNHIHLFCAPNEQTVSLNQWVSYWKRLFTQRIGNPEWSWQTHHWDSRLRRAESYDQKWNYVIKNPERAGLVKHAEAWPFHGELNLLRWYP